MQNARPSGSRNPQSAVVHASDNKNPDSEDEDDPPRPQK